jgi:FtsP/CotA-like multicopper oxidase with cupredoxin domain
VTNFHFHGFHISPQEHQDYVLLSLLPHGAVDSGHSAHSRGSTAIGQYDYDVPPLRYNQAPGTHWYHAHKHGATALQVLNGLVGTFEVQGPFDEQLEQVFVKQGHALEDRLMVVQQLQEQLSGLKGHNNTRPKHPLVNGQANPVVVMRPGEVQRWRFVGATMQASAQLSIGFEEEANGSKVDPIVRQIAMDGVQFAPENYQCQTLLRGPDCVITGTEKLDDFTLNPGNRIDVLIKAPLEEGTHHLTFSVIGNVKGAQRKAMLERAVAIAAGVPTTNPPLLTLIVKGDDKVMNFPTQAEFPPLPAYLADLVVPTQPDTVINYQMQNQGTANKVSFQINNKVYDPACVDESFTLNRPEQWELTNDSGIAHPFHIHIHTNPFQLVSKVSYDSTTGAAQTTQYNPPYIWQDTMAIPTVQTKVGTAKGNAVIRYEALNFTGEYVNHCHILGHEDREMMQSVQATCANGKWGKPNSDGSDECVNAHIAAQPMCPIKP